MRHDHEARRPTRAVRLQHEVEHLARRVRRSRLPGRLIRQHASRGSRHQRARHRRALPFAARQSRRPVRACRSAESHRAPAGPGGLTRRTPLRRPPPDAAAASPTFSSALNSGSRWWNWYTKPMARVAQAPAAPRHPASDNLPARRCCTAPGRWRRSSPPSNVQQRALARARTPRRSRQRLALANARRGPRPAARRRRGPGPAVNAFGQALRRPAPRLSAMAARPVSSLVPQRLGRLCHAAGAPGSDTASRGRPSASADDRDRRHVGRADCRIAGASRHDQVDVPRSTKLAMPAGVLERGRRSPSTLAAASRPSPSSKPAGGAEHAHRRDPCATKIPMTHAARLDRPACAGWRCPSSSPSPP